MPATCLQLTFRNLTTACALSSAVLATVSSCSCRFWAAIRSITRWPPLRQPLLLKVPPETIQAQISSFHNTGMRQKIYERDGFTIIEDCYNAGPESTEAALEILAGFRSRTNGRCIAVLGDMLELGNRSAAEHYRIGRIAATKADVLYTYGINAERMVSGAITGGMKQKLIEHFDTHEELAYMLKMRARPGDVILFKGSRGMRMEKALALFFKEEEE